MDTAQMELDEKRMHRKRVAKPLLWVGMVSIAMIFASLTSAYIVRQSNGEWLTFALPTPFFVSTALILVSSLTMVLAVRAAKRDDFAGTSRFLLITTLLGVGFLIAQVFTYNTMVEAGYYMVGTSASASFLYIITGLHALHIVSGVIALIVVYVRSRAQRYSSADYLGLSVAATYWHFLDLLWVYLLLFLLFIR